MATLAIANIMDIKPVLTVRDGLVVSCDKIRGGKKLYDKRADAAQRDAKRSIDRAMKSNGKYY